ncbi:uncharacterized protein AMSG_10925 [Thecamonas trahens ATCC 50062]|uniref:DUF7630 domain-containing protein n=1 Tax=Thecamonas trahens ATCC 50062 TaxID=461836 RepID=A0A0L0DSG4_THETB|nr:hypothetical protein AMSG_10925 [Thecamonas trahens ATCC 50062]KNC55284.1 hypothetical protein AMSG_10925 [Thecamonas trahens ATCC 50062]|eukprot:XP_013753105.1 hypothetical protein AMSG_10925 [Thecamonas trahens ATCC 50062]
MYGDLLTPVVSASLYWEERVFATAVDIDCDGRTDLGIHNSRGLSFIPSGSPYTSAPSSGPPIPPGAAPQYDVAEPADQLAGCLTREMGPAARMGDVFAQPWYKAPGDVSAVALHDAWAGDLNNDTVPDVVISRTEGIFTIQGVASGRWPLARPPLPAFDPAYVLSSDRQAVSVFDIDVDGDNDVVWFSESSDAGGASDLVWFANTGNGTFELPARVIEPYDSAEGWVCSLDVADINADGFVDIVWLTDKSGNVFLKHGTGPGTFGPRMPLTPAYGWAGSLHFMDYDSDGDLDVLLPAQDSDVIMIYINDAATPTSDFVPGTPVLAASYDRMRDATVGDVDADGDDDIVFLRSYPNQVEYLRHDAGATYYRTQVAITGMPAHVYRARLGDINNDGYLDVCGVGSYLWIFCSLYSTSVSTFLDPPLVVAQLYDVSATTFEIVDMDSDGLLDLVLGAGPPTGKNAGRALFYLRNDPLYSKRFSVRHPVGILGDTLGQSQPNAIGDLDGDGVPDFVVASSHAAPSALSVYVTAGPGTASGGAGLPAYPNAIAQVHADDARTVFVQDVDGDGDFDVLSPLASGDVVLLRNTHVETSASPGDPIAFAPALVVGRAQSVGDIPVAATFIAPDGVGVVWQPLFGDSYVWLYLGIDWVTTTEVAATNLTTAGTCAGALTVVDLDGDTSRDVVLTSDRDVIAILDIRGVGLANLDADGGLRIVVASMGAATFCNARAQLQVAHLNPADDSLLDLVLVINHEMAVFFGLPPTPSDPVVYTSYRPLPDIGLPSAVADGFALTDYNSDGYLDVMLSVDTRLAAVTNLGYPAAMRGQIDVHNNRYGNFRSMVVGDWDHDSLVDLIVYNSDQTRIHLYTGGDAFISYPVFSLGFHATWMGSVDIDMDGREDLLMATQSSAGYQMRWIPNSGTLPFFDPAQNVIIDDGTGVFKLANDIGVAPIDADMWPDLVVVGQQSENLVFFRGNPDSSTRFDPPYVLASWSSSCTMERFMQVVDLTDDGLFDFVFACSTSGTVEAYISGGPGGSGEPWTVSYVGAIASTGAFAVTGLELVDINSDGLVDVVLVSDAGASAISYAINIGSASLPSFSPLHPSTLTVDTSTFAPQPEVAAAAATLAILDANMDGAPDVLVMSNGRRLLGINQSPLLAATEFNHTHPGVGAALFASVARLYDDVADTTSDANNIAVADIDGDGLPDWLAVLTGGSYKKVIYSGMASMWRLSRPAATFRVDVAGCGYTLACVLREVVLRAGSGLNDTIVLPAGRYTGCWSEPYVVGKSVRLRGEGNVVIDCTRSPDTDVAAASTLFRIESADVELTLANMVITGAVSGEKRFGGGAFEVNAGTLRLEHVQVVNATALTASQLSVASPVVGFGGAVLLRGGRLEAVDSVFASNTAEHSGGAVAAIGTAVEIMFERVACVDHVAEVAGGCVFLESAGGASSLTLRGSELARNTAVGTSPAIASARRGGATSVILLAGICNVRVDSGSVFAHNAAREAGGGLFVRTSSTAQLFLSGSDALIEHNSARGGNGGGIGLVALDESSVDATFASGMIISSNSAAGSGGGLAASAESQSARCSVQSSGGLVLAHNVADVHGGGGFATGSGTEFDLTGAALERNYARRIGGGVAVTGTGIARVSSGVMRGNSAAWGGAGGATSMSEYLVMPLARNGFAIESSSASLEALRLADDEELSARHGGIGCGVRGELAMSDMQLDGNVAVYGSVGFACGSPVRVSGGATQVTFDTSARVGDVAPASGLFFACVTDAGYCGRGSDECCLASAPVELLGLPWMWADAASVRALNDTLSDVMASVGYGPMVATPLVQLEWEAGLPETVSSGAPLGSGSAIVRGYDGLGQTVVDPQLNVGMGFVKASDSESYAFVGTGVQQLISSASVSFGGVGIAARVGAAVGVPIEVRIGVSKSAVPLAVVPNSGVFGSVVVQACLPGSGALQKDGSGVLECALCTEGSFSAETSLEPCEACPSTTVLTGTGAVECLTCPVLAQVVPGFLPVPGQPINCTCMPGAWSVNGNDNVACVECPEGASCAGGRAQPVARPGYFPTADPGVFLECPNRAACPGGAPFVCAQGYTGRLCGACDRGYYALGGTCYKCDNRTLPLLVFFVVVAVAFVGLLVWLNAKEELSYRFAAAMIGFNSLQISAMYGQFELPWPNFASQFFNVVSFFNLNLDLSSPECATFTDNVWLLKWWLTVSLPLLFCLPFAIVYCSVMVNKHHVAPRLGRAVAITGGALRDACRRAYLQLMVLLYLPLSAMAMSYLQCRRDKDGRWVLEASPSKSCYGVWYWNYFGPAVVFCLGYAIGIPGGVYLLLTRVQRRSDQILFGLRYAFLVGRFTALNYRFEVWIMVRKVSVVMAMTFFRAPLVKANVALYGLVISLCHLVHVKPYASNFHNQLAVVCLASCVSVLWAGTSAVPEFRDTVAIGAIAVNVAAIVVGNIIDLVLIWRRNSEAEKLFDGQQARDGELGFEGQIDMFDDTVSVTYICETLAPSALPVQHVALERRWLEQ